jgi:hypothetical protein
MCGELKKLSAIRLDAKILCCPRETVGEQRQPHKSCVNEILADEIQRGKLVNAHA